MSGALIFGLIVLSLAGLGYLAWTDPKRRRVHGIPLPQRRRFLWPARVVVFGPGLLLTGLGHWSGLAIWAGAVTTLGWVLAALSPARYAALMEHGRQSFTVLRRQTRALMAPVKAWIRLGAKRIRTAAATSLSRIGPTHATDTDYIAALEARIVALEARLMRLEGTSHETIDHEKRLNEDKVEEGEIIEQPIKPPMDQPAIEPAKAKMIRSASG